MVVYLHTTPLYPQTQHHVPPKPRSARPKEPKFLPDSWVAFKAIHTLETGGVTIEGFNDLLLSVQADGSWEFRPLDSEPTASEVGTLNGSTIIFNPSGTTDPYVYPCLTSVV